MPTRCKRHPDYPIDRMPDPFCWSCYKLWTWKHREGHETERENRKKRAQTELVADSKYR